VLVGRCFTWSLACVEFVTFESRQISLIERNRSIFCSCYFYLSVCRWESSSFRWRRRGMAVGDPDRWELCFLLGPTGVGHPRRPLSSRVKSVCLLWETNDSAKTLIIFWSTFWALSSVHPNTLHLICNNFKLNFIFGIVCLCVCLRILASSRIPRYDLGRQTPHFWGGSVTPITLTLESRS
jgi:hypothetical protein